MANIYVSVHERRLSDGSKVYDLYANSLCLPCITFDDAVDMREKLVNAIAAHTNEEVVIRDGADV